MSFHVLQLGDLPDEVRIVEVGPRDGLQNEQNKVKFTLLKSNVAT